MCYSTMDCYNSESSRNGGLHYGTVVGETERVKVIEHPSITFTLSVVGETERVKVIEGCS